LSSCRLGYNAVKLMPLFLVTFIIYSGPMWDRDGGSLSMVNVNC
jgi:hypothetical protein